MAKSAFHLQVIEIPVRNVSESLKWYTEMFGLELCFPYEEGEEEACLNLSGMGFSLIAAKDIPRLDFVSAKGVRKPFFTFQVDNIKDFREEMIQKGVDVSELVFKPDGGYSCQFLDPSGNWMGIWGGWPKEGDGE